MISRKIATKLKEALKVRRAVMLYGPRQSGKSTLVKSLSDSQGLTYISLDGTHARQLAREDPQGFLEREAKPPVAIDEVQLAPELIPEIKVITDASNRPGQFLLTGSANFLTVPRLSESLAGRLRLLELYPLAQVEIEGSSENFVTAVFEDGPSRLEENVGKSSGHLERVVAGGYPEAFKLRTEERFDWFSDYLRTILQRDIDEIAKVRQVQDVRRLLEVLAFRSATTENFLGMSRDLQIPATTVKRYTELLKTLCLVLEVPAWNRNLGARRVKAGKIYAVDTGMMAYLLGSTIKRIEADSILKGRILETFVTAEIMKQATWSEVPVDLFHYRDSNRVEVDLVLESRNGEIVGVEIKSSINLSSSDFRGLRYLNHRVGSQFKAGVLVYGGSKLFEHSPGLWAVPLHLLW